MSSKNIFINKLGFNIIIITLIFFISKVSCEEKYNKNNNATCSVDLECNSGCCKSGKCDFTTKCTDTAKLIYEYQAIGCAVLVFLFSSYLMKKLFNLKNDFYKKIGKTVKDKPCNIF